MQQDPVPGADESIPDGTGMCIGRRRLIAAPAGIVAALLLERRARARSRDASTDDIDFAAFAARCEELARKLLEDPHPRPDSYLFELSALATRLDAKSVPRPELGRFGKLDPAVGFLPVHRAPPVMVIEWKLAPYAVLPTHSHTPAHVLSLCLEGECRIRHFERVGEAVPLGSDKTFHVRETQSVVLRPGRMTSLTPQRDDIHTFTAAEQGALGIDVNTFLPGEDDWSFLRLHEKPLDETRHIWPAHWIGKQV